MAAQDTDNYIPSVSTPRKSTPSDDSPGSTVSARSSSQASVQEAAKKASTNQKDSMAVPTNSNGTGGRSKARKRCGIIAGQIVDHKAVVFLTTVLTLYALTGDDIRILGFDEPDDIVFNWLVLICFVVFSTEVVLSCLGKHDYFLGFFFWLDLFSTASLILDLTYVAESMENLLSGSDDSDDNASSLRSGRTARIGARAARVVRVLRLVRILKLYKHFHMAAKKRQMQKDREQLKLLHPAGTESLSPAENDMDESPDQDDDVDLGQESRVGRKLSDMTTRRVILLILAMLMVIPVLQAEQASQSAFATQYGADEVWEAFSNYRSSKDSDPPSPAGETEELRTQYEQAFLRYVFYHNWFAGHDPDNFCPSDKYGSEQIGSCANDYYGQLFFFGIAGKSDDIVDAGLQDAQLRKSSVTDWIATNINVRQDFLYNLGTMPAQAEELLYSDWSTSCNSDTWSTRGLSLIGSKIIPEIHFAVGCPQDLRYNEIASVSPVIRRPGSSDTRDLQLQFVFDLRPFLREDSVWNLCITCMVMLLLVVGSLMFSHDANSLVLHPIEKMIKRVQTIRQNPLIAIKMADDEFKEAAVKEDSRSKVWNILKALVTCQFNGNDESVMETVILEKTIIKLGSFLALGFGEAGANIIGHNMSGADTAGVDAMIPGTRVDCIIGVVRIRDFSIANEVLQSKIMTFGNQIAEIVHGVCNEFHGAPNKNNGESFLIIWRVGENSRGDRGAVWESPFARKMAEMSVTAFATVLGHLHQSPLLASYRTHPRLQQRLGSKRCRVNLSFGLHAGWAIEGAVGSEYKIDASYLSPTVSITNSIERATEPYNVSIIVSEAVVKACSKPMKGKCRLIDNVMIKGSTAPMELYSVDLDYKAVEVDNRASDLPWNMRERLKARQIMETEKREMMDHDISDVFESDPLIRSMRSRYSVEFFQYFNMGYQNYAQGQWEDAKHWLSRSRSMLGVEDGPSTALLRFMQEASISSDKQHVAPKAWRGVRELDVKSKPRRESRRESSRESL